jgi:hypothetical protein
VNTYTQCFGNEAAVFICGQTTAQLNVREDVPRDVALQNLKFCHQGGLRPPLLVTQPGNLPSDKIGIVLHNSWCSSYIGLVPMPVQGSGEKMSCRGRDGDGVRAESMGHGLAAGRPVRRDEAGICCKMSVNESFHPVMRNSPGGRIKNRKKAAHRTGVNRLL